MSKSSHSEAQIVAALKQLQDERPRMWHGSAEFRNGWNAYAYGMNNPLSRVDPDGRDSILPCLALGCSDQGGGRSACRVLSRRARCGPNRISLCEALPASSPRRKVSENAITVTYYVMERQPMRARIQLWVRAAFVAASCLASNAQAIIEPQNREVALAGEVKEVHGYGPPGYGENKKTDAHITYWVIELPNPINVLCTPEKPEWAADDCKAAQRLRLVFPIYLQTTVLSSRSRRCGTVGLS